MVEIKNMKLGEQHFLGIHLHLPRYPVYLIMSTKVLLVDEVFSMNYIKENEKSIAVLQTNHCDDFESLLQEPLIAFNKEAHHRGVRMGMTAKDALMLCED